MVQNYNLNQKLLAYVLLIGLFLQSCGGFSNRLIPQEKEQTDDTHGTTEYVGINPLVNEELTAEKGYLVTFREENRELRANVRVDEKQPKPNYKNLLVELEEGVDLGELTKLIPKIQQGRIQLHRTQSGQLDRVIVSKGGLRGGMMEGNEKQKEKEPEKGVRVEDLLEQAKNGDVEAQYQLGKKAYDSWDMERVEESKLAYEKEARKWLGLAATNKNSRAVKLLEILNKHRFELPVQSTDNNFLRDRNRKEEREKEKTSQNILKLTGIKDLRCHFTKGYLEIIPSNYKQLIEFSDKYGPSFMNYDGGVVVKSWERSDELSMLVDLLFSFSKIKKFKVSCAREDKAELAEVIGRAVQFYEELTELDLNGCQLSDGIIKDLLESIAFPEKLKILDVSNNNLSTEMLLILQRQFPSAQIKSNLKGSSQNSSQPSIDSPLSVNTLSPLREKGKDKKKEKAKKAEASLGILSSTSRATSLNNLPSISYDKQVLSDVMDKIPMNLPVKEGAILYLKNIQKKVKEIKTYQLSEYTEHFYHAMKGAILEIKNTARLLYEFTKPYDHILSNKLQTLILESLASFEKDLNRRLEMSVEDKEALMFKTKRLYAEQSYICRQGELQKRLMEHLNKIKQLLADVGKPFSCCYISYAWPSKENQEEEYWVQPFLSMLYDHLTAAGIRVVMDIRDNKPGDSIYKFMQQYHDGNYMLLVGTKSLLEKHYSIRTHAIQTELSIINNRFEEDQNTYGYSRIYPMLISGTLKSSFPEIYDQYRTVRDVRELGYLLMLRRLLDWIYEQQINKAESEYENLWRTFDKDYPELFKKVGLLI